MQTKRLRSNEIEFHFLGNVFLLLKFIGIKGEGEKVRENIITCCGGSHLAVSNGRGVKCGQRGGVLGGGSGAGSAPSARRPGGASARSAAAQFRVGQGGRIVGGRRRGDVAAQVRRIRADGAAGAAAAAAAT